MTNIGGKKKKRSAKFSVNSKRELLLKEEYQEYGLVENLLGDCRLSVLCSDSTTKICHIRGKFKRRVWINVGDTVLVSLRDFESDKGDIIHKYNPEEAIMLKTKGEFDPAQLKNLTNQDGTTNIQNIIIQNNETEDNNSDDDILFEDI
jgi:translation initiation factor 1A